MHKFGPAGQQGAQGIAPVAAGVFFVPRQFCGGFARRWIKKNRVVAKAVVSVRAFQQGAFPWGWKQHQGSAGNFIPLPYPQLDGLEGRWQGQKGENLLYVGTEMPAFPYRLDAHPSPLQIVEYRKDKARFFEALGRDVQACSLYRPYFPVPGSLRDADWVLERFPAVRMATGTLSNHLYACRLLVLDHNGTTLLESLVANIPMTRITPALYAKFCSTIRPRRILPKFRRLQPLPA